MMGRSALSHRVLLCIAITLILAPAVLATAWAASEPLKPSARATQLLNEAGQNERLITRARENELQAEQALQQAHKALQLSIELQDAQAEAVAQEAVVTAEAALTKARSLLVDYKKRRDAAVAALGRTGRSDVEMSLSDFRGEVYMRTSAGLAKIDMNFKLQEGDVLVTGKNSIAVISLADGSRIEIGENTEFKSGKLARDEISLELLAGIIKSSVKKLVEGRHFVVHTAGAAIGVRGTEFSTEVLHGVTTIRVQRGEVEVTPNKGNAQVLVGEGQYAIVREDGTILGPRPDQADTIPSA
jgi:ferric-dicitrate binding protein FerR (iron transport regulator)